MGKQLGKGMREFKDSVTGNDKDEDDLYASELPPAEPVTATTSHPRERDSVS
jgi:Sec-independent protein translocase protein TatA